MGTRLHIILLRLALTILVAVGGLMLLSAVKTKDSKPCSEIMVVYKNGTGSGFLPKSDVVKSIRAFVKDEPVGVPLEYFDLQKIEKILEGYPWVYDAQLYFDNNQALHVIINEAVPMARVIDAGGHHFYIDHLGNEMPLSASYRADLPVFTGVPLKRNSDLGRATIQRIIGLSAAILADSFWLSQAAQIDVGSAGKMEMVPAIGNHTVYLGFAAKPELMLAKLKQFYLAISAAGKLDEYVRLNATYEGQVVAQRDSFKVPGAVRLQAMDAYRQIITENKRVVDANSIAAGGAVGRIMGEVPEKPEKKAKAELKRAEDKPATDVEKPVQPIKREQKETVPAVESNEPKKPKAIMPKLEGN